MMKPLVVLLGLFFLAACGKPVQQAGSTELGINCKQSTGRRMYVYGDSISLGMLLKNNELSYPQLIACREGLELVQKSIGGTTITDNNQAPTILADIWESDAVIFYAPGANDAIQHLNDSIYLQTYRDLFTQIVAKIKSQGNVAYLGTPLFSCYEPNFMTFEDGELYAEINRDVVLSAQGLDIHLIEYRQKFEPNLKNTVDCLHPNKTGHQELSNYFYSSIGAFERAE